MQKLAKTIPSQTDFQDGRTGDCNGLLSGMDAVERSHNHLRTELVSGGPARNLEFARNKIACRQMQTSHEARGGSKCSQPPVDVVQAAATDFNLPDGLAVVEVNEPARGSSFFDAVQPQRSRGSVFVKFSNTRMASFKAIMAPDRALAEDELADLRMRIKLEWARVLNSPLEYERWEAVRESDHIRDRVDSSKPVAEFHGL